MPINNDDKSVSEQLFWEACKSSEVLDREEERELIGKAQQGDSDATEQLVNANQRLVAAISRTYYRSPISGDLDFMDLVQVGNMGVIRAIGKFDLKRDVKFSTYATLWIRAKIRRYCLYAGTIMAIPYNRAEGLSRAAVIRNRKYQELEREPTIEEIAEELGKVDVEEVGYLLNATNTVSIDSTISDESETSREELLDSGEPGTEELFSDASEIEFVIDKLRYLPHDMHRALILRFGLDHNGERTLNEIAQELGVSRTQCSRLIHRGIASLRSILRHAS